MKLEDKFPALHAVKERLTNNVQNSPFARETARRELVELSILLDHYQSTQWQPIETAPMDECMLMLIGPLGLAFGRWSLKYECWLNSTFGGTIYPTHWQPLPKPPQEDGR